MSTPDRVFEALSSTTRREILAYLREKPLHAGALAERFEISKPALSKHLSLLEGAGLVWRKREGQFVLYGMEREQLAGSLMSFLQEVCPTSRALRRQAKSENASDE